MKKLWLLLFISLSILFLTGCSGGKNPAESVAKPKSIDGAGDIESVLSVPQLRNAMFASTKDGCYIIKNNFNKPGMNICYADYASEKMIYLSNKVDSRHCDEDDTSFFENASGNSDIFVAGDKLYCYAVYFNSDDSSYFKLYQMDFNGENRRTVLEMGGNYSIDSKIGYDGVSLYFPLVESTADGRRFLLSRLVLDTGELMTVKPLEMNNGTLYYILGTSGRNIVLKRIEAGEDDDYLKQEHSLIVLNADTGETTEILKWLQDKMSVCVHGQYLYYLDNRNGDFRKIDLNTQEDILIKNIRFPVGQLENYMAETIIRNDLWIFWGSGKVYMVNIQNGEITEQTMRITGSSYSNGAPTIYGESDSDYFIIIGDKDVQVTLSPEASNDGMAHEETVSELRFGLISKEDYWNDRLIYREIEDLTTPQ